MNSVRLGHVRLTIVYARVYVCVRVLYKSRVRVVHLRFLPATVALFLFLLLSLLAARAPDRVLSFSSSHSSV